MTITSYLATIPAERKEAFSSLRKIITDSDVKVVGKMGKLMGKTMLLYTQNGAFKYGLANEKNHILLQIMPLYCYPTLRQEYQKYFRKADITKSCIHVRDMANIDWNVLRNLIQSAAILPYPLNK